MRDPQAKRMGILAAALLGLWLGLRFFLRPLLPFVLGALLAAAVQPAVEFLNRRLRLPRGLASALGVTVLLVLLGALMTLLGAVCCREAALLLGGLPRAAEQLSQRAMGLRGWALEWVSQAPALLREPLEQGIRGLFSDGGLLLEQLTGGILRLARAVAGGISGGALAVGTGILSSYLISARYPQLHDRLVESALWARLRPVLDRLGRTLGHWCKAQLRLSVVTFSIVLGGFWLLGVEQGLLWAVLTAVIDAIPMLGTGLVLLPMAALSLLWGSRIRALGLVGVYVTAAVTRSVLEPRWVGKQLGLSPLGTLLCLYLGLRLWGIWGMLLAPVLTVLALQLARAE